MYNHSLGGQMIIDLCEARRKLKEEKEKETIMEIIDLGCYLTGRSIDDIDSFSKEEIIDIFNSAFSKIFAENPSQKDSYMKAIEKSLK